MKNTVLILTALFLFPALVMGGGKEEAYFKETVIPLARDFLQRIGQTNNLPLETNQVKNYKVDYFKDRPGCAANLRLTNNSYFFYDTESNKTEIWSFHRNVKTYYNLVGVPQAKIEAVKALRLQNKLSKDSALVVAQKYFKIIGHKEENFHTRPIAR